MPMIKNCHDCGVELTSDNRYGRHLRCKKCYNQTRKLYGNYREKHVEFVSALTDEIKAVILKDYGTKKVSQIARQVGIPYYTVYHYIKKLPQIPEALPVLPVLN